MIIGLTGPNGAGKGEVLKFLRQSGLEAFSLSDLLREELVRRGCPVTRENLIEVGNELRRNYGSGVLAERVLERLTPEKNYVIDSIRHPEEVKVLRRRADFRLIRVAASEPVRFERLKKRGREGDPQTLDKFRQLEKREVEGTAETSQQLKKTAALADCEITNDGTVDALQGAVRATVQRFSAMIPRPDWDSYFMEIAKVVALRSNCLKRKVASILAKDRRIIATGYNGTPRGVKNCNEGGCPRCNSLAPSGTQLEDCFCSHAEENAITQSAYHGVNIKGATLYTTYSPCLLCTKMIINSGVAEVVYQQSYSLGEVPLRLLQEAGITTRQI